MKLQQQVDRATYYARTFPPPRASNRTVPASPTFLSYCRRHAPSLRELEGRDLRYRLSLFAALITPEPSAHVRWTRIDDPFPGSHFCLPSARAALRGPLSDRPLPTRIINACPVVLQATTTPFARRVPYCTLDADDCARPCRAL